MKCFTGGAEMGGAKQRTGCYLWTGFSRRLQDGRLVGAGVGSKSILQEERGGRTSRKYELREGGANLGPFRSEILVNQIKQITDQTPFAPTQTNGGLKFHCCVPADVVLTLR